MNRSSITISLLVLLTGLCSAIAGWTGLYLYLNPNLPTVEKLREIKFQTPLRIYSNDNELIGEFGEIRRVPVSIDEAPPLLIKAFLAAEDDRFYSHNGVDIRGIVRAVSRLVKTGEKQGGGSTITMQVAKNSFPINDGSFTYKAKQIFLALKIEKELSKNEIMELYINQNFLGNRAEGVGAAAQVYYGKAIDELTVAQLAMIAGLPKAPSAFNPLVNPERALERRDWILGRMFKLDFISEASYKESIETPVTAVYHGQQIDLSAPYIAEMVRKEIVDLYGDKAYTEGYRVFTTVDSRLQKSAQRSVINGLITYTDRHGYHSPEQNLNQLLPPKKQEAISDTESPDPRSSYKLWASHLQTIPEYSGLLPAAVIEAKDESIQFLLQDGNIYELPWENGPSNARPYISEDSRGPKPKNAQSFLSIGDVIRVYKKDDGQWHLTQLPKAQASLIALDPNNGAIRSLVGGFDFSYSNYNRATQAKRQPGSNFKPFVYAAALENGFTAATIVNDAPIIKFDSALERAWRPENSGGKYSGPIRLREGLYRSKNYVAIRVLDSIGFRKALKNMDRFGFEKSELPKDLTLALGSHVLTPMQVARGYTVFANGGYKVEPYFINRIENEEGELFFEATPATVCNHCDETENNEEEIASEISLPPNDNIDINILNDSSTASREDNTHTNALDDISEEPKAPLDENLLVEDNQISDFKKETPTKKPLPKAERVMDERVAYIMDSILKDVIVRGTGTAARKLNRSDIAGKTGTVGSDVNNFDAWFSGYNQHLVATAWIGFDQNLPLGKGEYGAVAALPIWMDFMKEALKDIPETPREQPAGLVSVRVNSKTGLRSPPEDPNFVFELFRTENIPELDTAIEVFVPTEDGEEVHPDELF
ncbi:MAG: penicillin-binding protein 1A [Cellvibrionaceae bacterium]